MRLLASFLFASCCLPGQAAPSPAAKERPGTCILAGGGRLPASIFARFHELAGGKDAVVVLIPTASQTADDAKENEDTLRLFRERLPGASVTLLHTRDRAKADDAAFAAPLRVATGVWIGGGTQERLATAYLGTRVEKELMALLARGGVIAGTSAGTAIQTRTMIQEGMENPVVAQGFDFVPGAISDQHFLKRRRLPRLLKVLGAHPGLFGIGVDESTAVEVRGDMLRVIGASKAVLVLSARNGHEELVREVVAFEANDPPLDLGTWRRAAAERATWSLEQPGAPRLENGTLLIGAGPGIAERFVSLAGGSGARIVVLDDSDNDSQGLRNEMIERGAANVQAFAVDPSAQNSRECEAALADATGVVFGDGHLHDTRFLLARRAMPPSAKLRDVLARGGVVWGNGIASEVVPGPDPTALYAADPGYCRGLGLLPGTMIVRRKLPRNAPGDTSGPVTDGSPHEWVYRHATRMPRILAIHVESAAIVTGSTLEVLGEFPTYVLPTHADGKPGDQRERVTLEPGAKWDLVAQKRL